MIEEIGTVVELKSTVVAAVLCKKSSLCQHCASAGLCHTGADSRSMLVDAHNLVGAVIGDRVRLVTSSRSFLQSSFILYIVPLLALIVGAVMGQLLGNYVHLAIDPNLLAALFGTAFLIVSLLLIRFATRALPRENYMPRIVEILKETEA